MDRRDFLKNATYSLSFASALFNSAVAKRSPQKKRQLTAYYLRAHMYTIVPHQIREDMEWMADLGTDNVAISILEQDFTAAAQNINIICREAERVGMSVYGIPTRWGGMFAGAPKVPSLFSVQNPNTWVLKKDGSPLFSPIWGVISSVHYPETFDFFISNMAKTFELWNLKGIIWDEPKLLDVKDYSPKAIQALGENASLKEHVSAFVDFLSKVNYYIKSNYPDKDINLFAYAHLGNEIIDTLAEMKFLDCMGCDGRPWGNGDGGKVEGAGKVLLGKDAGERYLTAARRNGKNTLWLIENHNMNNEDVNIMDKRLPEVLRKDVDHLIYYYFPRNLEDPYKNMAVIKKHLTNFS